MSINYSNEKRQREFNNKSYFDKNVRSLTKRQVIWMQEYLSSNENIRFSSVGSTNRHEEFIAQLSSDDKFRDYVEDAYSKMTYKVIPDREFNWLINNLRGQIFTLSILYLENGYNWFDINSNDLMEEVYRFFDNKINENTIDSKISLLSKIERIWFSISSKDNYSKWISESNKEQIDWTKDYLRKTGIYNEIIRDKASLKEVRSHVLASLDIISYPLSEASINNSNKYVTNDRKEIIIDKMKRAWSQQKYRDAGKTKKSYHLPLTIQTHARLEKMAEVNRLSQTAMLDILINSEYNLKFLDVDGNEIY